MRALVDIQQRLRNLQRDIAETVDEQVETLVTFAEELVHEIDLREHEIAELRAQLPVDRIVD